MNILPKKAFVKTKMHFSLKQREYDVFGQISAKLRHYAQGRSAFST
jgi:hypothetical protein